MTLARLVVLSFSSSALAFVLELILARTYGASPELDAYRLAHAVFIVGAQMLVYHLLPHVTVPMFARLRAHSGDARAWGEFLSLHATLAMVCGAGVLLVTFAAPSIAGFLAPGIRDPAPLLRLLPLVAAAAAFYLLAGALAAAAGIYGQFAVGTLTPLLVNIALVAAVLLLPPASQVIALGGGTLLGAAVSYAIHVAVTRRLYRGPEWIRPTLSFGEAKLWLGDLLFPVAAGLAFGHAGNVFVQRSLAGEGPGAIAMFSYAVRLTTIVYTPAALYGSTRFPALAAALAHAGRSAFRAELHRAIWMTLALSVPIAVLLWLVRLPLVTLLFGSGKLDTEALASIARMLGWAILSAPAGALSALLVKALAAASQRAGLVAPPAVGLAVLLALVPALRQWQGAEGIAAAYALWIVAATILQLPFSVRIAPSLRK